MTVASIETAVVRDADGRVHELNPLGGFACLGCSLPFPCPTAVGGEQLRFDDWPKKFVPASAWWDGAVVVRVQRMPDGRYAVQRADASTVLLERDDLIAAGITP